MKILLHHRELVVSGSGIPAYLDVPPQKNCGLFESFAGDAQIRQLQQGFGKIGVGPERLLVKFFRARWMALPLFDVSEIEQAGRVVRIPFEPSLKILARFIESSQTPVRNSHESVRLRRGFELDQFLELRNSLFRFFSLEIALTQRRVEIG